MCHPHFFEDEKVAFVSWNMCCLCLCLCLCLCSSVPWSVRCVSLTRFALSGTMRSITSVLLEKNSLGDLLDAHALGWHLRDGEEFLCEADHSLGENPCKHWI